MSEIHDTRERRRKRASSQGGANVAPDATKRIRDGLTVNSKTRHPRRLRYQDYTIGWICALHKEMAAGQAMLDEIHETLPGKPFDTNTYTLGRLGTHNVAMACLPAAQYGTNNAAIVGANMLRTFPHIEKRLMVGIGGGIPDSGVDVRLGDVVVGDLVIQYDLGKALPDGQFVQTSTPTRPPPVLMTAVSKLRANHDMAPSRIPAIIEDMLSRNHPGMSHYARPTTPDHLYHYTYNHVVTEGEATESCQTCNKSKLRLRSARKSDAPAIHYGGIASGNTVVKDGRTRHAVSKKHNVLCFETEAAGLMEGFPCLVIRGICDYSDSHKNKKWQEYAAATAAAYAKELLLVTPSTVSPPRVDDEFARDSFELFEIQKRLLNSLVYDEIDSRHDTIKPALSKTCEWFLHSHAYMDWRDPAEYEAHHGFLWISGKPGAGKSTLMKFLYAHMKKTSLSTPDEAVVAFFFNARGVELEKSTTGMYRSLLFHTLQAFPDLCSLFDFGDGQEPNLWTLPMLQEMFCKVVENLGDRRLSCFIDALDECNEAQIRDMVELFEDLGNTALHDSTKLYICLSSRHYPHVEIQPCLRPVLEHQAGHSRDIEAYVHSKLRSKTSSVAVHDVTQVILSKAAGVFMWVVLVIETLREAFARGDVLFIKRQVKGLPSELSELFSKILTRDTLNMDRLLLCIQWILFAERPLTREEFFFAIYSGTDPETETLKAWDPDYITLEHMELFLLSTSKGLAELNKASPPTVQFIHESVRDYLVRDGGIQQLWPELSPLTDYKALSHDRLRACCEFYMKVDTSAAFPPSIVLANMPWARVRPLQIACSQSFPFLEYAAAHILDHADAASSESTPQEGFLRRFDFRGWLRIHILFEKYGGCHHTMNAGQVYLFAEKNWTGLLRLALSAGLPIESPEETWRHPLIAASANGHEAATRLLLSTEEIRSQVQDILSKTRFRDAIDDGYESLVKALLQTKGQWAYDSDASGHNSLCWAVRQCNDELARLFLAAMASTGTEVRDSQWRTPLSYAAELGLSDVVSLLVQLPNVQFDAEDYKGRTAAWWVILTAVKRGVAAADALETALDVQGAPRGSSRITPLMWAMTSYKPTINEIVNEMEAVDINSQDDDGRTVLSWAAVQRSGEMVEDLLKIPGINVNLADKFRRVPLGWAAYTGCLASIRHLLSASGIEVDPRESSGRAPLSLLYNFHNEGLDDPDQEAMTSLLLNTGAVSINSTDNWGRTALSYAAEYGTLGCVKLLLDTAGIDKHTRENLFGRLGPTAAEYATKRGRRDIAQLFCEDIPSLEETSDCSSVSAKTTSE